MKALGYRFALGKLDRRYGVIKVSKKYRKRHSSGENSNGEELINMVQCDTITPEMDPEYLFKDDKYEIDPSAYLCPEPSSELIIRGNFYS